LPEMGSRTGKWRISVMSRAAGRAIAAAVCGAMRARRRSLLWIVIWLMRSLCFEIGGCNANRGAD
jgi:hypothetical protein